VTANLSPDGSDTEYNSLVSSSDAILQSKIRIRSHQIWYKDGWGKYQIQTLQGQNGKEDKRAQNTFTSCSSKNVFCFDIIEEIAFIWEYKEINYE